MQDAMGRLLRAVELDPALMAARVELAQLAIMQCIYGYLSPRIAAATVRRAADGIPELNEQAEALLPALGWVEFHFDRDARSALRMMARSAGLPYDATNTRARSWLLLSRHRFGEAIELLRAAIQLDPYSPWLQAALAWALHLAGEREASVAQIRKAIDFSSEYDNSLFFGAMILAITEKPSARSKWRRRSRRAPRTTISRSRRMPMRWPAPGAPRSRTNSWSGCNG